MVYQLIILFHMTIFVHKVLYYDINLKFLLINIFNFILPNNTLYFHSILVHCISFLKSMYHLWPLLDPLARVNGENKLENHYDPE